MGFENGYKEIYFPKEEGMALAEYRDGMEITIRAIPLKEISYKQASGYGAYLCEEVVEDSSELPGTFTLSGNFITSIDIGQTYEIKGTVQVYRGKKQIKSNGIKKVLPTNKRGIISFLKSLEDIQFYPEVIYEAFKDDALRIVRDEPLKILEVAPALWEEKVLNWQKQLLEIKDNHYILAKLMGYGLKPAQIKPLFEKYGESILEKIERNPYFLASEVRNYSFKRCDNIAKMMGLPPNDQTRLVEGVSFVLNEAQYSGNTYLPRKSLIVKAKDELSIKIGIQEAKRLYKNAKDSKDYVTYSYGNMTFKISLLELSISISEYDSAKNKQNKEDSKICVFEPTLEQIEEAINILDVSKRIHIDGEAIYDYYLYQLESNLQYNIRRLHNSFKSIKSNVEPFLDKYCETKGISLEKRQKDAILQICSGTGGVFVLDGSAGCGKTFCLGIAIEVLKLIYNKMNGYFYSFTVAPTGKAAQVAAKATKMDATTVHKLLKYNPETGYAHNAQNPLFFDLLIVDESSMLDVELASALFEALTEDTKVVLVGDTKQLPSVGAGNVLRDIIASKILPMTTLNVVKRQGKDSGIIKNANRIIAGEMIETEKDSGDAFVLVTESQVDCAKKMLALAQKRFDAGVPLDEIQILCPQKNGIIGTSYMNFLLQERFNKNSQALRYLNKEISIYTDSGTSKVDLYFQKGDKVIHTKNNYKAQWFDIQNKKLVQIDGAGVSNGECGTIISIREREDEFKNKIKVIFVRYDSKIIKYEDDFSELDHAYALTIHKSQGSQWNTVIMPIMSCNFVMLDREIFYTGYTRAQQMIFVVGEQRAMKYAVSNVKSIQRFTGLKDMLINN